MMKVHFPNNFRLLRKLLDYSQDDIAEVLQSTKQSISRYERGTAHPNLEKYGQICELFKVSLHDLVFAPMTSDNISSFINKSDQSELEETVSKQKHYLQYKNEELALLRIKVQEYEAKYGELSTEADNSEGQK